ncbi:hypothetical protein FK178_03525 [Antarcticibacterium arcticum]|uniref:Uncharacterized protein n=1 Tax=Antarcticibacterium arcticum TaxID=2585771 RepID=A0A5B8YKD0_9FLAO|nr:hypothetical protein [Antarcticibacterium arcticum]QED36836.1 hypothetical protein FK178_03525 [Antarcticibacterium arcticum]
MKLQNRLILLGVTAMAVGGFVLSQIFIHEKNRKELREIAKDIADHWKEKLDLTPSQTEELENIIIEFTIKKNDIINSDAASPEKIKKLQKVQRREHRDLKKILNEEKFNTYTGTNKNLPNNILNSISA